VFLVPLHAQDPADGAAARWADSVMQRMKLRQQAAQLVVARVPVNMTAKRQRRFLRDMREWQVGGVCFFAGTTDAQRDLTCRIQEDSREIGRAHV